MTSSAAARRAGRTWRGRLVAAALALAPQLGTAEPVHSAVGAPQSGPRRYDIPDQSLGSALARFAEASGVDVLVNDALLTGRRSAPLQGDYAAPQALHLLLAGTGLVGQFTSARSAVIFPNGQAPDAPPGSAPSADTAAGSTLALDMMVVTAPRLIGRPRNAEFDHYARRLATDIRGLLASSDILDHGENSTLRIQIMINSEGALRDVTVLLASDDPARDARIVRLLEGRAFGAAPPENLPQPLIFDLRSR